MRKTLAETGRSGKVFVAVMLLGMAGCSVNPATGEKQFTALMPAGQEESIGSQQHPKILAQYGGPFPERAVEAYVNQIGQKVAVQTERSDVSYKFFVLDTPMVNAFAMPGGYIYVTRGLLALANSEAELAGVLAHEIGHITARHSAERYSQGMLAGLGMAVLSAAVKDPGVGRVAGVGSDLALKSYSRDQEYQADELGVRYLSRAGYDPFAVADFLRTLDQQSAYEKQLSGKQDGALDRYFATHPQTDDRSARAGQIAATYPASNNTGIDAYLRKIDGLSWGDSARTGFVRGRDFIHPELGFVMTFPAGFSIENTPSQVRAISRNGVAIIFDGAANRDRLNPQAYLQAWARTKQLQNVEPVTVNGVPGATGTLVGAVNGTPATVRMVVLSWKADQVYRFLLAMPGGTDSIEPTLQKMVFSFRAITPDEREQLQPLQIDIVTAQAGDSVETLSRDMSTVQPDEDKAARFRVLNGMKAREKITPGRLYKRIK